MLNCAFLQHGGGVIILTFANTGILSVFFFFSFQDVSEVFWLCLSYVGLLQIFRVINSADVSDCRRGESG